MCWKIAVADGNMQNAKLPPYELNDAEHIFATC